jgi:hypothetical protein
MYQHIGFKKPAIPAIMIFSVGNEIAWLGSLPAQVRSKRYLQLLDSKWQGIAKIGAL